MTGYYNTTNETNPDLAEYRNKADKQEDVIYAWFQRNRRGSPSRVNAECLPDAPLTSIRRAITNLTDEGKLVKTAMKVKGPYGRNEFVWELVGDTSQQELF